jgi:hypothetical protein
MENIFGKRKVEGELVVIDVASLVVKGQTVLGLL